VNQRRTKPTRFPVASWLRFLVLFVSLLCAYYLVVLLPWCDQLFYDYLAGNAMVSNSILHLCGQDTQVSGVTIRSVRFAISVRRGCDGIEPAWFFASAILAFPGRAKGKAPMVLAGGALILSLNLARIVSLYFIGIRMPSFFPIAHLEIWPVIFILVVLLLWIAWIRSGTAPECGSNISA
jgi:exosortase H (IPTLxxWG-CTERM-specific)